jgi:multiple sugar transport system permease protein
VATLPVALLLSFPVIVMIGGALKPAGLPPPRSFTLPQPPFAWENFQRAAELVDLPRALANSLLVAAVAVPGARIA